MRREASERAAWFRGAWAAAAVWASSLLLLTPGHILSQDESEPPVDAARSAEESLWQWEADLGYGYGIDISSEATFLGDVRFTGLSLRLGRLVGRPYLERRWLEGRARLLAELPVWVSLEPERGFAAGATLLARYTVASLERLRPFGELGVGPIYLDFDNDRSQADGFSFTLQGGAGVMYRITSTWAVTTRAQLHHISNAGLRRPNPGINDVLFTIGFARQVR